MFVPCYDSKRFVFSVDYRKILDPVNPQALVFL